MLSVLRLVRIVKLVYSLRQRNAKGLAAISHLIRLLRFAPQVAVYAKPTLNVDKPHIFTTSITPLRLS